MALWCLGQRAPGQPGVLGICLACSDLGWGASCCLVSWGLNGPVVPCVRGLLFGLVSQDLFPCGAPGRGTSSWPGVLDTCCSCGALSWITSVRPSILGNCATCGAVVWWLLVSQCPGDLLPLWCPVSVGLWVDLVSWRFVCPLVRPEVGWVSGELAGHLGSWESGLQSDPWFRVLSRLGGFLLSPRWAAPSVCTLPGPVLDCGRVPRVWQVTGSSSGSTSSPQGSLPTHRHSTQGVSPVVRGSSVL